MKNFVKILQKGFIPTGETEMKETFKNNLKSFLNLPDNMKKGGCIVEAHIIDNLRHGFGVGKGTPAEGWIETAIKFWEKNMKK